MKTLLPEFMEVPFASSGGNDTPRTVSRWKIVDLGCGTGRTTMTLLDQPHARIYGLDVSEQMLKVAKSKVEAAKSQNRCTFFAFDAMNAEECPKELSGELQGGADSVISALVIEHLPLETFFGVVKMVLKPHGTLLLTNMHSDMGAISQAGFVKEGIKIRPQSYIHTIPQVLEAAAKAGFKQVREIREREVTGEMVNDLGVRAKKWVGVKVWFSVCFQRF